MCPNAPQRGKHTLDVTCMLLKRACKKSSFIKVISRIDAMHDDSIKKPHTTPVLHSAPPQISMPYASLVCNPTYSALRLLRHLSRARTQRAFFGLIITRICRKYQNLTLLGGVPNPIGTRMTASTKLRPVFHLVALHIQYGMYCMVWPILTGVTGTTPGYFIGSLKVDRVPSTGYERHCKDEKSIVCVGEHQAGRFWA
jgi:hypothetical protein